MELHPGPGALWPAVQFRPSPTATLMPRQAAETATTAFYRGSDQGLWIGTFHALFARLLRFDIDK